MSQNNIKKIAQKKKKEKYYSKQQLLNKISNKRSFKNKNKIKISNHSDL